MPDDLKQNNLEEVFELFRERHNFEVLLEGQAVKLYIREIERNKVVEKPFLFELKPEVGMDSSATKQELRALKDRVGALERKVAESERKMVLLESRIEEMERRQSEEQKKDGSKGNESR